MRVPTAVAALLVIASPVLAQGPMMAPRGNGPPIFPDARSPFGNQPFPPGATGAMRPGYGAICRVDGQACQMTTQGPIGTLCTCRSQSGLLAQGVVSGQ